MSQVCQVRDIIVTRGTLGLLVVSVRRRTGLLSLAAANWVCALLVAEIAVVSGSLSLLAVTGVRIPGAITPVGVVAFIAARLVLAWVFVRS
jgi:uncharacterized membrane protein YgdD (TMEM256/DUF423 family)